MDRRLLPESCTRSSACFPEKPLLRYLCANCCLSRLRRWGCVRGLSALGERLAACGHIFSRRGSREAGEPRRGAPPKAQADAVGGGAKGAKRPEGRCARRALGRFDLAATYAQARRVLRVFICFKEF